MSEQPSILQELEDQDVKWTELRPLGSLAGGQRAQGPEFGWRARLFGPAKEKFVLQAEMREQSQFESRAYLNLGFSPENAGQCKMKSKNEVLTHFCLQIHFCPAYMHFKAKFSTK